MPLFQVVMQFELVARIFAASFSLNGFDLIAYRTEHRPPTILFPYHIFASSVRSRKEMTAI